MSGTAAGTVQVERHACGPYNVMTLCVCVALTLNPVHVLRMPMDTYRYNADAMYQAAAVHDIVIVQL